jgi:hypothetical protein
LASLPTTKDEIKTFVARFYATISVKKTYEISGAAVKQANPRPVKGAGKQLQLHGFSPF